MNNKKIEVIQTEDGKWYWIILKCHNRIWRNEGFGIEETYEKATTKAYERYNLKEEINANKT